MLLEYIQQLLRSAHNDLQHLVHDVLQSEQEVERDVHATQSESELQRINAIARLRVPFASTKTCELQSYAAYTAAL